MQCQRGAFFTAENAENAENAESAEDASEDEYLEILTRIPYLTTVKVTITSQGQVTIPIQVRRNLNLQPGDILDFDENAGCVLARPAFDEEKMRAALGCLTGRSEPSSAEWLVETRGEVENPPETR